jgi:trehalose/maltose hydrolase-like predicted phosphorylase
LKQADVVLLGYPLNLPLSSVVRRADLDYYSTVSDENGPAMTWGMHAVGYIELGDDSKAASFFNRSFANQKVHPLIVFSSIRTLNNFFN